MDQKILVTVLVGQRMRSYDKLPLQDVISRLQQAQNQINKNGWVEAELSIEYDDEDSIAFAAVRAKRPETDTEMQYRLNKEAAISKTRAEIEYATYQRLKRRFEGVGTVKE